eukprot:4179590-Amphidinium_carterae.1
MLDSGSDEHCVPQWFVFGLSFSSTVGGCAIPWIEHHGQRQVTMTSISRQGEPVELSVLFQVTSCSKPLMSLGKLEARTSSTDHGREDDVYCHGRAHASSSWLPGSTRRGGYPDDDEPEVQVGLCEEGDRRAIATEYGPIHMDFEGGDPGHTRASRVVDKRECMKTWGLSTHGPKGKADLLARRNHHERRLSKRKSLTGLLQEWYGALSESRRPYAPMVLPAPEKPSDEEREAHAAQNHTNYAAWCEHCVRGKAKDDGHFWLSIAQKALEDPVVEFDYMFLSSSCDRLAEESADIVVLAMVDTVSQLGKLVQMPGKRVTDYVIYSMVSFVDSLGVQRVVKEAVKAKRTQHTHKSLTRHDIVVKAREQ